VMRGAEVGWRGRHPALLASHALHRIYDQHVAVPLHQQRGGYRCRAFAPWALRLDEAIWPIKEVVREAEFGWVHWQLHASSGRPLQDDIVRPLDGAHDLRGKMGRCDPVGRVH
jgi:hypothetical protein